MSATSSLLFIAALLFVKKIIKRAFKLGNTLLCDMKVNSGGFYRGVSQEPFDGVNVCSPG
jgi:hypothetical protein